MFDTYDIDGIPLVEATSKFLNPIHQDDEVDVESWIEEWGNKTFIVHHEISKAGELLAKGREVRAWVIRDDQSPRGIKAAAVPEDVRQRFLH